uniref:Uncharacterized protein n=1 Tax=Peronospora matthiolae TaxID=2874970 RepID=A0AAV1SXQ2_9STRA
MTSVSVIACRKADEAWQCRTSQWRRITFSSSSSSSSSSRGGDGDAIFRWQALVSRSHHDPWA